MRATYRERGKASDMSPLWENHLCQEGQSETALHQILQEDGSRTRWESQSRGCLCRGLEIVHIQTFVAKCSSVRTSVHECFIHHDFTLDLILIFSDLLYCIVIAMFTYLDILTLTQLIVRVSECGKNLGNNSFSRLHHFAIRHSLPPPSLIN